MSVFSGGYLLDSWQAYIDGEIEHGKRGFLIAASMWYNQDVRGGNRSTLSRKPQADTNR